MPTGHETVSSQMEPEHGCFSIRSSEVLGLRSTLTSCLGDNAPKGVIVGQGETCSTFICGFTYPALNDPKVKAFIKNGNHGLTMEWWKA